MRVHLEGSLTDAWSRAQCMTSAQTNAQTTALRPGVLGHPYFVSSSDGR